MRRDRSLQIKMLKHLRGDDDDYASDTHSEEEKTYNAALLVEEGLVRGIARKNHLGGFAYVRVQDLTPSGHDFLDKLDGETGRALDVKSVGNKIAIFISHSSSDEKLADQLAKLFQLALSLSPDQIRCTSINGYRLPVGADTNEQLRAEVRDSKVLVGIITGASMESTYVLFELGARWGANLPLCPVLGDTAGHSLLRGPLSGINVLDLKDRAQVHQLLENVSEQLGLHVLPPSATSENIEKIVETAKEKKNRAKPAVFRQDTDSKFRNEDPASHVLRALALLGEEAYSIEEITQKAGMPILKVRSYLNSLASLGYVEIRSDNMFELTQQGCDDAVENLL